MNYSRNLFVHVQVSVIQGKVEEKRSMIVKIVRRKTKIEVGTN